MHEGVGPKKEVGGLKAVCFYFYFKKIVLPLCELVGEGTYMCRVMRAILALVRSSG